MIETSSALAELSLYQVSKRGFFHVKVLTNQDGGDLKLLVGGAEGDGEPESVGQGEGTGDFDRPQVRLVRG